MRESGALARGALMLTAARVLGLVATLVQVKLTVTHLGAEGYGMLTTAVIFTALAAAWSELGVGAVVVRRVAKEGADLQRQVGLSLALSAALVLPQALLSNLVAHLLYPDRPAVRAGIAVLTLGLMATTWSVSYTPVAQVTGRFGYLTAIDLLGRPLSLAVVALVVVLDGGIGWFFAAQLVIPLTQLTVMLVLARHTGRFRPVWAWDEVRALVRESLPITYIVLIGTLYFNIDGILLSLLAGSVAVGVYGLGYRVLMNMTVVSAAVSGVILARVAADSADPVVWRRSTATAVRAILVVAAPVAVLTGFFAEDLIHLVGSPEMVGPASGPLQVLAVAVAISMVSGVASTAVIARGAQGLLTRLNTANLVLNIVLNVVLIPRWEAMGAAVALVVSEVVGLVVVLWFIFHEDPRDFPWRSLRLVVPLAAAGLVAALLPAPFVVRAALTAVVYLAGVLATQVITRGELAGLRRRPTAQAGTPQPDETESSTP